MPTTPTMLCTENGAPSLSTTTSATLDLFFGGLVRGAPSSKLRAQMRESWASNPEDTVALLMHARDPRKGKGERKVVQTCLLWMRKHKPKTFLSNLEAFVELGCYKDLSTMATLADRCKLPALGVAELAELELLAKALQKDMTSMNGESEHKAKEGGAEEGGDVESRVLASGKLLSQVRGSSHEINKRKRAISLAAKWAPTEGTSFDKKAKLAKRLAYLLFPGDKAPQRSYRKAIGQLRSHLKVVERSMCAGEWEDINFSAVPAKAHKNLKSAFRKHQEERYDQYLSDLQEGKNGAKINSSGLQPHELVKEYLENNKEDATTEAQWQAIVEQLKQMGTFDSCVAVVDVSGSMSGVPMQVAIALGLVVSELSAKPFRGRLLTFDAEPTWHTVRGGSLCDRVRDVARMPWGMNTNIEKVFDLILQQAKQHALGASAMPKTLYIFSDMQFDEASPRGGFGEDGWMVKQYATTHARASAQFAEAGYALPQIVYWNLRGDTADFPTSANTPGVAMVSGFSAQLLKLFLAGGELSPLAVMRQAIKPYRPLVVVEDGERGVEGAGAGEEDAAASDKDLDSEEEEDEETQPDSQPKRRKVGGGGSGYARGGRGKGGRRPVGRKSRRGR